MDSCIFCAGDGRVLVHLPKPGELPRLRSYCTRCICSAGDAYKKSYPVDVREILSGWIWQIADHMESIGTLPKREDPSYALAYAQYRNSCRLYNSQIKTAELLGLLDRKEISRLEVPPPLKTGLLRRRL